MREKGYYWVEFLRNSNIWNIALWEYNHWVLTGSEESYYDKDLGRINEKQIKKNEWATTCYKLINLYSENIV